MTIEFRKIKAVRALRAVLNKLITLIENIILAANICHKNTNMFILICYSNKVRYEEQKIGLAQRCAINKESVIFIQSNYYSTKITINELVILLKYQLDWNKIVDFLLIAYF